jgi:ankyrin repeat protein
LRTVAQPEGKYPVQLAIERNQPEMVKFLFRLGADINIVDTEGNNCLHYAALASTQMIEVGCRDALRVSSFIVLRPFYVF